MSNIFTNNLMYFFFFNTQNLKVKKSFKEKTSCPRMIMLKIIKRGYQMKKIMKILKKSKIPISIFKYLK